MPSNNDGTVVMEGVRIIFRNFTGKEGQYNREGDRNFGVLLDEQIASDMAADGWNIKSLKPREDDEDETEQPWLPVAVGYGKGRPPSIYVITTRDDGSLKRTALDEHTVEMLDWADIVNVDLIVRPYHYDVNGKQGVKAYVKSLFVTIEEDELERKYSELEEPRGRGE